MPLPLLSIPFSFFSSFFFRPEFQSNSSPAPGSRPQDARGSITEEESRQKQASFREDSLISQSPRADGVPPAPDARNPLGAIGNEGPSTKAKDDKDEETSKFQDPLAGMAPIDRWGIKGLHTLMNNYPDYNALVIGMDASSLGRDLNSSE